MEPRRLVHFCAWADPSGEELIRAQADIATTRLDLAAPPATNWAALERAHGFMVSAVVLPKSQFDVAEPLLARASNLLAICSTGAGFDTIDVDACTRAGVLVCSQLGANKEAVAEHALGFMLTLSKKIIQADHAMRRLNTIDRDQYWGTDLTGRTVGVVGLGHIGTRVAELCGTLFKMRIIAHDPYLTDAQFAARGAARAPFDELLAQSDFITVHCPRTKETTGMFGRRQFAAMKRSAYFLNTARFGIHDEDALAAALKAGEIAGAGIDVFQQEPPPQSHPLLQFDNVAASPHIAGVTYEARRNMSLECARQWMLLLRGEAPPRPINPEVWPRFAERFERILGTRPKPLAA